jgi:hypothetical protein
VSVTSKARGGRPQAKCRFPAAITYRYGLCFWKLPQQGSAGRNALRYTPTYEIKELGVPVSQVEDLKKFYRVIANDERGAAMLKPAGH